MTPEELIEREAEWLIGFAVEIRHHGPWKNDREWSEFIDTSAFEHFAMLKKLEGE